MMSINSHIWRQEVNAEWRGQVATDNQARPSVGMFKLGKVMNLMQRNHVCAIRLFGEASYSEQAAA